MSNVFLKFVLRASVSRIAAQPSVLPGQLVQNLAKISRGAAFVGVATLSDSGSSCETSLRRRLHNHDLLFTEESIQVVIRAPETQDQCHTRLYLNPIITSDEVQEALSSL